MLKMDETEDRAARRRGRGDRRAGVLGVAGGAMVALGTVLPWFTLFAGLQPYRGILGLYGKVLLGGGLIAALAGAVLLVSGGLVLRRAVGVLGLGMAGFALWLMVGLFDTYRTLQANPMLVAQLGPGLFVAALGAALVAAGALPRVRRPAPAGQPA